MIVLDSVVRAEIEDIYVRIGEELFASEAACGYKRNVQALGSLSAAVPDLADEVVDNGSAAANRSGAISIALECLTQLCAFLLIQVSQLRKRGRLSSHSQFKALASRSG
jgi:hypothetical protein